MSQQRTAPPELINYINQPAHIKAVMDVIRAQAIQIPMCHPTRILRRQLTTPGPVLFGAEGQPTGGSWKETLTVDGCSQSGIFNVMTVVDETGQVHTVGLLPGTTRADPILQRDAIQYAYTTASRHAPAGCKPELWRIIDTAFDRFSGEPLVGVLAVPMGRDPRPWVENWTVLACDVQIIVHMRFIPDATGTTINAGLNQRTARALPAAVAAELVDGATMLIVASQNGNLEAVRALLAAGADVNAKRGDGATPLIMAAQNGHLEVVRALLAANADVNAKRGDGATPLIMAAQNGHLEVVRALLAARADVNATAGNGATALMMASANGHLEVVRDLLAAKADVRAKRDDGATASIIAAQNRHPEIVRALLAAQKEISAEARSIDRPAIAFLNLSGASGEAILVRDRGEIGPLFGGNVQVSTGLIPKCDVLFLYCTIEPSGRVAGQELSLRDLIGKSGARVAVIASEVPIGVLTNPEFHKSTARGNYPPVNLAITANRNGDAFTRFYRSLFEQMWSGVPIGLAWVALSPQSPHPNPNDPGSILQMEAGHVTFGTAR